MKFNIRPTTSVYSTYRNQKYDPWGAIAEFVDNSTQSYYDHEDELLNLANFKELCVSITYKKENGITILEIKDNAYGMNIDDFQRAIVLDSPPARKTRSEFGMGLKTAACWFGQNWSVETTQLGVGEKYKTTIDVAKLKETKEENVECEIIPCDKNEHGTTIRIWNLNRTITGRQTQKTKNQLKGMYRSDLRTGKISIRFNDEPLFYTEPKYYEEILPDNSKKLWKKDISFKILCEHSTYSVNGFIALLDEGSTSGAGFTLLRKGRVIIGGYENCYRPEEIFEKSNSYIYQRLVGELNMDDWPVTQSKDDFDWYNDGLEDKFIDQLIIECKEYCEKAKVPKGKNKIFNVNEGIQNLVEKFSNAGIINNVEVTPLNEEIIADSILQPSLIDSMAQEEILEKNEKGKRIIFNFKDKDYIINFIFRDDDPDAKWLNVYTKENEYVLEWNIKHPFFESYIDDPKFIELMEHFTFALVLSEFEAEKIMINGSFDPTTIRINMNETLKAVIKGNK